MLKFVKSMAPGWFAAVMGTSVASLAAWLLFNGTAFQWVADVLHILAIILMVFLGSAAFLRIALYNAVSSG